MLDKIFTRDLLKRFFTLRLPTATRPAPVAPGLYHVMREINGTPVRFHLRVDRDGSGMLLANASAAARLTPGGTLIAKRLLEGSDDTTILRELETHFGSAAQNKMLDDITRVRDLMDDMVMPSGDHPIINFEDSIASIYESQLIAPLQATLPLAEPDRMLPIINRLWEISIPQIYILVPPRPDAQALVRAIERAEDLGMIAGVRGRSSDLHNISLLRDIALAGVDYITIPYASVKANVHNALYGAGDHAIAERTFITIHEYEVCPVAEVPLVQSTVEILDNTLDKLAALDVQNISLFAVAAPDHMPGAQHGGALSTSELLQMGSELEEHSHQLRVQYVWQAPVLRDPELTLAFQVQQGPRCSGDVAVLIEPDGTVIPPRGAYRSVGNLVHDRWEKIWQDPAFRIYRERVEPPTQFDIATNLDNYTETHIDEPAA